MPFVRLTWLQPRPDSEDEVCGLMHELDDKLAQAHGLLASVVLVHDARVGRASLWTSKEEANREALSDSTLSMRSHLRYLSMSAAESMLEVDDAALTVVELESMLREHISPPRPAVAS